MELLGIYKQVIAGWTQKTELKDVLNIIVCCVVLQELISHVAQSCYSVIGDKPFLWSKPKFDPP